MQIKLGQNIIDIFRGKKTLLSERNILWCKYKLASLIFNIKNLRHGNPQYDEIISLGYNCEVSFRIKDILGKIFQHYYSWIYIDNRNNFINSLNNTHNYLDDDFSYLPNGMYLGNKTKFAFHSSYKSEEHNIVKQDLLSKLKHLALKTETLLTSNKRILFIIKVQSTDNMNNDLEYITNIRNILKQKCLNKTFTLLCVFEKVSLNYSYQKLLEFRASNVVVVVVEKFANIAHTDYDGDILGWLNAIAGEYYEKK